MASTTDRSAVGRMAVYAAIGLVLVVVVILGVRFAKNRAEFYATTPTTQPTIDVAPDGAHADTPTSPTPKPVQTHPAAPATNHQASSSQAVVPATGPQDVVLQVVGFSAVGAMGVYYLQARRRMRTAYQR